MYTINYEEDGNTLTVYPTAEVVAGLGVWFVALKDVPAGVPFEIRNDSGHLVGTGEGADIGSGSEWEVIAAARLDGRTYVRVQNSTGDVQTIELSGGGSMSAEILLAISSIRGPLDTIESELVDLPPTGYIHCVKS